MALYNFKEKIIIPSPCNNYFGHELGIELMQG